MTYQPLYKLSLWLALTAAISVPPAYALTQAKTKGYLQGTSLDYTVPVPPSAPELVQLDLVQVRSAQQLPTSALWLEAEADARAYNAADIIERFDDASGEVLEGQQRPILVAMLQRVIKDAGFYVDQAKVASPRPRPYVEDSSIKPCNTEYLKDEQSYPSGHAMNGYVVAVVLSQVISKSHEQAILARGIRYGDNRVVCGVHHPTDVQQGRLLGVAYLKALVNNPEYQADLTCAREEETTVQDEKAKLSAACAKRRWEAQRALKKGIQTTATNLL